MFNGSTSEARSKLNAVGNLLDSAATIQSITRTYCRESAARRLESGRDADFLINGALRVQFPLAVEAVEARNVMEGDDAVAGCEIR